MHKFSLWLYTAWTHMTFTLWLYTTLMQVNFAHMSILNPQNTMKYKLSEALNKDGNCKLL